MNDHDTATNGRDNLMQIGKPEGGCGCGGACGCGGHDEAKTEHGHAHDHGAGHHSKDHFQSKLDGPTSAEAAKLQQDASA